MCDNTMDTDCSDKEGSNEDCESQKGCNPLLNCNCCMGFKIESQFIILPSEKNIITKFKPEKISQIRNYSSSLLRPPQLFS